MEMQEVIDILRKFRRKWRREITREHNFQKDMRVKYPGDYVPGCYEKSVGIDIGYSTCTNAIDNLIKTLEVERKQFDMKLQKLVSRSESATQSS